MSTTTRVLSPAERLDRMISYGDLAITPSSDPGVWAVLSNRMAKAHTLLCRIAPEVMTQQDVAKRWPHILAALIVESDGYFSARSAANAVLSHKLGRAFSCEYYCHLAGFERDGFPTDPDEWDRRVKKAGREQLKRAVECRCARTSLYRSHGVACDGCGYTGGLHRARDGACPDVLGRTTFCDDQQFRPVQHGFGRHKRERHLDLWAMALDQARRLAETGT